MQSNIKPASINITYIVIVALFAFLTCVNLAMACQPLSAQSENVQPITEQIQWKDLLASYDLVWNRLPRGWKQAPFLGNGEQGTMLYQLDGQTLRWDLSLIHI